MASRTKTEAPFWSNLGGFERLLEHRVRLGICTLLARHDALTFSRLKSLLEQTDGSLGAHLGKLEKAGFLAVDKTFEKRKPKTWYRLTPRGRKTVSGHLEALKKLIRTVSRQLS